MVKPKHLSRRRLGFLGLAALILLLCAAQLPTARAQERPSSQATGFVGGRCVASEPVHDRPPDDPHASTFQGTGIWYTNADRTVWAWWWGRTWTGDYKVLWVRPAGARLTIGGKRLDGDAEPVTAVIPDGYSFTFQATGVNLPSSGCWQIEGTADDHKLTFVVSVP
jgi:hypothetical protein